MLTDRKNTSTADIVKKETAILHQALENHLIPHLQAIQSNQDYAQVLSWFFGFNLPVEQSIRQYVTAEQLPDIEDRGKAWLAKEDIESLSFATSNLKICKDLPRIGSVEEAMGALYVLEGSTLGGKIIAKMLEKKNPEFRNSLRFFTGYGKETGSRWTYFLHHLNMFDSDGQVRIITASANETFLKFKYWIEYNLQVIK